MFEIICYSMTGKIRQVAEAIAAELGVVTEDVKSKDGLAEGSFVFLGAASSGSGSGSGEGLATV